jgi:hypothetical protein
MKPWTALVRPLRHMTYLNQDLTDKTKPSSCPEGNMQPDHNYPEPGDLTNAGGIVLFCHEW